MTHSVLGAYTNLHPVKIKKIKVIFFANYCLNWPHGLLYATFAHLGELAHIYVGIILAVIWLPCLNQKR